MKHLVFAYGTLRPSLYPEKAERFGLTRVTDATVAISARMVSLGAFPALLPSDEPHVITGELVEVDSLDELDGYEGVPTLYTRETINAVTARGQIVEEVAIYIAAPRTALRYHDLPNVPGQDWQNAMPDYAKAAAR